MYLTRLELRGFKTFAVYTDFLFDAGITAIVGPNGSGKSNIADAVRWVLGEQTYSAMRGKRTEDMIFAGTSRRPQLGMAEAVMTFDNSSQWLPLDFSEVTVSRRAYRSGENQYFVNGSHVRLRDVLELLGKAGLARGGFTVIGQGLVDAALSLRPEERRTLFEEAAGIRIYREKRDDAVNKLAETQQNVLRLNDILNEITPRLRDLERQAKRAEERELLQHDLEKLLRVWYGYHWQRLQARLAEAEGLLHRRLEEVNFGRARQHEVEAVIASTQARQSELRRQLALWHKASADLHGRAEVSGRELAVSRERLHLLQQRHAELDADFLQLQARRSAREATLAAVRAELQSVRTQEQEHTARLRQAREQWQRAEAVRAQAEKAVEDSRDGSFGLATALADTRNRLTQALERRAQVLAERQEQQGELASVEDELSALHSEAAHSQDEHKGTLRALDAVKARQNLLQERLTCLERELEQRRTSAAEAARTLQRSEDRQDMLQGLRESLAGFAPGVKAVLEARDRLPGVIGPVAGLLRVSRELERAVEVALGEHGQSLVVEHWDDAVQAISLLNETTAGRATFLPLDTLSAPSAEEPPAREGVLGLAQALVEYDARFQTVMRFLLGGVIIVRDLQTACRSREELRGGQRIVTLAGEVVGWSGTVSGGSESGHGGLLTREREWRELTAQLTALREQAQGSSATLQETETQLRRLREEAAQATEEWSRLASQRDGQESSLTAAQQRQERLQQEIAWRRKLDEQQAREVIALDEKAGTLQHEADLRSEEYSQTKASLERLLGQLQQSRIEEQSARQAVTESEAGVALAQRQAKMQEQIGSSQQADLERLQQEMADKSQRLADLQRESAAVEARVEHLQQEGNELSAKIAALAAQLDPAEAEVLTLENQLQGLEKELARARQRVGELEVLYNQQMLEKEREQDALETMEHRVEEDLGDIEYPSERVQQLRMEFVGQEQRSLVPSSVLPESLNADIRELKARLRRLGAVNPGAPQEYREVLQRHAFLHAQMTDLQDSSADLQKVIKELDEVMEKEFLSVFTGAAEQFSHYFEYFFGGGQARLTLTDPENPSTSGVEILARPPGRRQQSLALLSGGERALTATALLFAVLKTKPVPFCLLDEVDAMLDEANVSRFRDRLAELADQTQFIVISHNRTTIEAANTIYGISMTDDGISRALSLRLREELPVAG